MATTENGVYYQDDYTKIADILADMEKMAESIDELIEKTKYDDTDVKNNIKTIQEEQKVQSGDIEDIENKDTEQDKLIQKLQSNMIQESTEQETSIHIEDASDLPAVLSVKGNHYQETQEGTSNLAVLNEDSITQDGITVSVQNGVATVSGTNTNNEATYIKIGTAYLYANKTYYLRKEQGTAVGGYSLYKNGQTKWFEATGESSIDISETGEWSVRYSVSANASVSGTLKFGIYENAETEYVVGKKKIPSIEYPSSVETVKDSIKIIQCNSNFLKKQNAVESVTAKGLTGTVTSDGTITLNGTTTGATYIQLTDELKIATYTGSQNFEKHILPIGNYKFISETSGQTSANIHAYVRNSTGASEFSESIQSINDNAKKEISFEIDKKQEYIAYIWIAANTTLTNFTMKFMLKRSDDNSDYVQNEQKEYNLPVQQEMLKNDYFDLTNIKEVHNYEKKNMNELEWQVSANPLQEKTFSFVVMTSNKELLTTKINCYSNCFKSQTASYLYNNDEEGIAQSKSQIICRISKEKVADIEEFKTLLAEKNAVVYAKKQIKLDLTEEQKQELNKLQNLELFRGTNNIYTEQDLALLQLDYTADTKMYIDSKIKSQNTEGES